MGRADRQESHLSLGVDLIREGGKVLDRGSSSTVAASLKLMPRLLTFAAAFSGSHSNSTDRVYGAYGNRRTSALRLLV
jgi:hypothetical protein